MVHRCADRSRSSPALLLAAVSCALVLAVTGCNRGSSGPTGLPAREPSSVGSTYAVMQMNLCLSGFAGCSGRSTYPAVLKEAVVRIRDAKPDAVTLNEACRSDVELIARQTGYHLRFSRVLYRGERLRCVRPGDRGLFGDAVLTEAAIEGSDTQDFEGQAGPERRRWLCVTTRVGVDVCTAHLNTRSTVEVAGNDAQCAELAALLARRSAARTVTFGGDVNRRASCAPDGIWTRTDRSADQAPGLQHVYGSGALRSPAAEVVAATHTDHDILLVHARRTVVRSHRGGVVFPGRARLRRGGGRVARAADGAAFPARAGPSLQPTPDRVRLQGSAHLGRGLEHARLP
jgi:endonuclease/exonuclease/phosphatase family metal-dependent hydrolase